MREGLLAIMKAAPEGSSVTVGGGRPTPGDKRQTMGSDMPIIF